MFNLSVQEIEGLCNGRSFRVPDNLTSEQFLYWVSLSEQACEEISCMNDPKAKEEIKRQMIIKKVWDEEVLNIGGISFYCPTDEMKARTPALKNRYRVALTLSPTSKLRRKAVVEGKEDMSLLKPLKFKIKDASGNIFSVASKTCGEAQAIVDSIYGKGHYKVSQMIL